MTKHIHNQKGLTLVELLAAITITSIILVVAIMLLSSVVQMFQSNSLNYQDKSAVKLAVNTLTDQLSDSTQAVYYPLNNEFRYKTGNGYKSVILDTSVHSLTIYDFSNNDANFKDGTITLAGTPSMYTNPKLLADNVSSVNYTQSNGTVVPAAPLTNGQVITITMVFSMSRVNIWGTKSSVSLNEKTSVKLLVDTTSK